MLARRFALYNTLDIEMSTNSVHWHLYLGEALIATIRSEAFEFPWTYGKLVDSPGFERFRIFFSDEDSWPETQDFEDLCKEIRLRGEFIIANIETGDRYDNVCLNHSGENVWFRYS